MGSSAPVSLFRRKQLAADLDHDRPTELDVVGESFGNRQAALERICGGRTHDGHTHECFATLKREPANPQDNNAIAVTIDGDMVGYIPRDIAADLAPYLDRFWPQGVTVRAVIRGGWDRGEHDRGHFGVKLYLPTIVISKR